MSQTLVCKDIYGNDVDVLADQLRWRPSAYAIIIKNSKILLVPSFGGYSLPGGGIELSERLTEGLAREVKEETGLTVEPGKLLGVTDNLFVLPGTSKKGNNVHSILLYYKCTVVAGELSHEGFDEAEGEFGGFPEWVPLADLPNLKAVGSADWRTFIPVTVQ